ncbi:hypothetical protein BGX31_010929, partial [Mortierella sp. GBA43]
CQDFGTLADNPYHGRDSLSPVEEYLDLFNEDEHTLNDKMRAFCGYCQYVQSLTISHQGEYDRLNELLDSISHQSFSTLDRVCADLWNLVHLAFEYDGLWQDFEHATALYGLLGMVVSQNPGIQEIECRATHLIVALRLPGSLLNQATRNLKRLSASGFLRNREIEIFKFLINASSKNQRQEHLQTSRRLEGTPLIDGSEDNSGWDYASGGGCELEELVLQDFDAMEVHDTGARLNLTELRDIPGVLPIRSLTFLDFVTTAHYDDEGFHNQPRQANGSLLAVLEKCPNLEKLRVSFVMGSKCPQYHNLWSQKFIDTVEISPWFLKNLEKSKPIAERGDFVEVMYRSCPNITEIELALTYQFTASHWDSMMQVYGPQLRSLSVWGNLPEFGASAFLTLLGPPISHPSRDTIHCLTRLNINGLEQLHCCAWMALKYLPQLKEFRARGVCLDARYLIMEGGWICKGLEILEIYDAVPRSPGSFNNHWHWCDSQNKWVHNTFCCQCGMVLTENGTLNIATAEETTMKHRKNRSECSVQLQIKVCKLIGQLTQLRELRLEGEVYADRDCLELTLEAGLDRLAPLKQNLETLTVCGLENELSGKAEVEWIARNWIHHQNPQWLNQHASQALDASDSSSPLSLQSTSRDHGAHDVPSPKFKSLVGISERCKYQTVNQAKTNIKWLEVQCPTLKINTGDKALASVLVQSHWGTDSSEGQWGQWDPEG